MTSRRSPAVAGQFYPGDRAGCRAELAAILGTANVPPLASPTAATVVPVAGVVPHAGWTYSGAVAGRVLCEIAAHRTPSTVVLFGADHWGEARTRPQLHPAGSWLTPLGEVAVDAALAERVLVHASGEIEACAEAHRREHSIEVQVPLLQTLWPQARILPILVGPRARAADVGRLVAEASAGDEGVIAIGSTDLTHYGPNYDFTSHGHGRAALDWVKGTNDAGIIALATALSADEIVPEALRHLNACGPGAMAAAIGFALARGAVRGRLLAYTTSHDVHPRGEPRDFVGYAGIVFDAPALRSAAALA